MVWMPMSSPQITRMLGLLSAAPATPAKTRVAPRAAVHTGTRRRIHDVILMRPPSEVDYRPSCAIAARSGAFETWISPSYGAYISRIRNIAPDTDSAETNKLAITVAFEGAKRPKLRKITVSHSTRMTSMGREIDVVACSYINQRVFPISIPMLRAWL